MTTNEQHEADRLYRLETYGRRIEHPDGWAVMVVLRTTESGPGLREGELTLDDIGDPWLTCRESWDAAHPGVEPTENALAGAMLAAGESWLEDEAVDQANIDARYL